MGGGAEVEREIAHCLFPEKARQILNYAVINMQIKEFLKREENVDPSMSLHTSLNLEKNNWAATV